MDEATSSLDHDSEEKVLVALDNINKKHITRYKENRLDYQVLIEKKNMKKEYNKYIKNITTLDDIMLLYIRGKICED